MFSQLGNSQADFNLKIMLHLNDLGGVKELRSKTKLLEKRGQTLRCTKVVFKSFVRNKVMEMMIAGKKIPNRNESTGFLQAHKEERGL